MSNEMEFFIAYMIIVICYGFYYKIWEQSRTTLLVICATMAVALLSQHVEEWVTLLVSALLIFLLFIRAVFRKNIKKSKYKDIFYA